MVILHCKISENYIEKFITILYNKQRTKKISSGQGDQGHQILKFPTGGIVRDPLRRLIW